MSGPFQFHCKCGNVFLFMLDLMETCLICGREYGSHRSKNKELCTLINGGKLHGTQGDMPAERICQNGADELCQVARRKGMCKKGPKS